MTPSKEEFLKELTAMSLRHGVLIGACGCCGGPYLEAPDESEIVGHEYTMNSIAENIKWRKKNELD